MGGASSSAAAAPADYDFWWIATDNNVQEVIARMRRIGIGFEYQSLGMPLLSAVGL